MHTFNGELEFSRSGCKTYKSVLKSHGRVNDGSGITFAVGFGVAGVAVGVC